MRVSDTDNAVLQLAKLDNTELSGAKKKKPELENSYSFE